MKLRFLYILSAVANMIICITYQVDLALGASPLSLSFITGLGTTSVQKPLHWSRWQTGVIPTPGIGVFGPASHMPFSNPYYATAYSDLYNYPSLLSDDSPFPVFRRFADHFYLVYCAYLSGVFFRLILHTFLSGFVLILFILLGVVCLFILFIFMAQVGTNF